jgi:8-oxo-dGTP diphosphatase
MTTIYANYGESKVKLTWKSDSQLPPMNLITSVHGFCFYDNKLLLVDLDQRGWDFPGGHKEANEKPEECLHRETMEEGYVEGICSLLGYIEVDHSENSKWSNESPYPKIGYQAFYRLDIKKIHPFEGEHESVQRTFITPEEITQYYPSWNELFQEILESALSIKHQS